MMAKKAIYLDERELDLTVRVFEYVLSRVKNREESAAIGPIDRFALRWTSEEVGALCEKFLKEVE
jgi:hypothetical protein